VNVNDLLTFAKRRLAKAVFDYVDDGAEDGVTLRQNCEAFKQVAFRPKKAV
jgi:isopentenyl diphosphate isomerase/L-lactate dehydrogenase-like FMN-dependent dehydrogenase